MSSHTKQYLFFAFAGLSLGVGIVVGVWVESHRFRRFFADVRPIRNAVAGYRYSAPLLGIESPPATEIGMYANMRSAIKATGDDAKRRGDLTTYGVYFKDLDTPLWFGINEDSVFLPASLYKLPIALAIYKETGNGVLDLDEKLRYTALIAQKDSDPLDAPTSLRVGSRYTVRELVARMITDSDNGAKDLLGTKLRDDYTRGLWEILNIGSPRFIEEISVRDYALFFRLLYSSTYLDIRDSEEVLKLLVHTEYKGALVAGVPADIEVAHKWGIYNLAKQGETGMLELHDCGIIYAPDNPYLLCVMTKGASQQKLEQFIASVSRISYEMQTP